MEPKKEEDDARLHELRLQLRLANQNAGKGTAAKLVLVSDMKKTQTFIRKLKALSDHPGASLVDDAQKLNLSKYVDEVALALADAKLLKSVDILTTAQICSAIHQRHPEFMAKFLPQFLKVLPSAAPTADASAAGAEDEKALFARRRGALRLLAELFLCGVINETTSVLNTLKALAKTDKGDDPACPQLSLIIGFFKYAATEFLGQSDPALGASALVPVSVQTSFITFCDQYSVALTTRLQKRYTAWRDAEREALITKLTKGINQDAKLTQICQQRDLWMSQHRNTTLFLELIHKPMPAFDITEITTQQLLQELNLEPTVKEKEKPDESWEDDEARSFYCNIPDLRQLLPAVLFEDALAPVAPASNTTTTSHQNTSSTAVSDHDVDMEEPNMDMIDDADLSVGEKRTTALTALFDSMQAMYTKEQVDEVAEKFCHLNNKQTRKRFIKTVYMLHRNDLALIPYYCRLIALISIIYPEVAEELYQLFRSEFFRLTKRAVNPTVAQSTAMAVAASEGSNYQHLTLELRIRNAKFVSEFLKFQLLPSTFYFDCLRACLHDLHVSSNVEVLCTLLENGAGRLMYCGAETQLAMKGLLEKLSSSKNLIKDAYQLTAVEGAIMSCKPTSERPGGSAIGGAFSHLHEPELPVLHKFVIKLLTVDLNRGSLEHILVLLKKLPWDEECLNFMVDTMSQPHLIGFEKQPLLASLVSGLSKYRDLGIRVADKVIENIRAGLLVVSPSYVAQQSNNNKFNLARATALAMRFPAQRRLADIRFLGELFNYQLIPPPVVFQILNMLITLGHSVIDVSGDRYNQMRQEAKTIADAAIAAANSNSAIKVPNSSSNYGLYLLSAVVIQNDAPNNTTDSQEVAPTAIVRLIESVSDPPTDMLRVRLVLQLLKTTAEYFDRGIDLRKLNRFCAFFQRYLFLKPLTPIDLLFEVWDTLDRYAPKAPRFSSLAAAQEKATAFEREDVLQAMRQAAKQRPAASAQGSVAAALPSVVEQNELVDDEESDADENVSDTEQPDQPTTEPPQVSDDESSEDSESDSGEDESESDQSDDDDEPQPAVSVRDDADFRRFGGRDGRFRQAAAALNEEDQALERELQMLMSSAVESRKLEEKKTTVHLTEASSLAAMVDKGVSSSTGASSSTDMTLKLITRKHNKPQARTLHVPVDAALAKQMRAEQAAKELERQEIKSYVMRGVERAAIEETEEEERSRRAILVPGVSGSGAPAAVAGYRELPKRAVAVSFPSVKSASTWTSGLDRAVGSGEGAVPMYQEYRPRTGPTTGASPAGPTAAQLSAASAANAAAAIASIRQQATQNVVQNLINSEIKPGGGIRSGAAGGPKGKASKPQ